MKRKKYTLLNISSIKGTLAKLNKKSDDDNNSPILSTLSFSFILHILVYHDKFNDCITLNIFKQIFKTFLFALKKISQSVRIS